MNINRIPPEVLRLYGGRSQNVRGGGGAAGPAGSGNVDENTAAQTARSGDDVVLSQGAAAMSRAFGLAKAAPAIREELVSELRQQVQTGTYQLQDEAVARRLLSGAAG